MLPTDAAPRAEAPLLWLREHEVVDLVSMNDAIDALEAMLRLDEAGGACNAPKALGAWGLAASIHGLCSYMPEGRYCGTKTWINTPGGAAGIYALFDQFDGRLPALMEMRTLGSLRTAGISGLATKWLAAPDADTIAIIGSGRQAMTQLVAVACVRPIRRVNVYSPTPAKRLAFAQEVERELGIEARAADTLEQAVADAPIVTLITRAREPFLRAGMLARGAHVNAPGAALPANAEFFPDLFERADVIAVDNLVNARIASREFREHFGTEAEWPGVRTLGSCIVEGRIRRAEDDLTLFKSVGMGISDLAMATLIYERAVERGLGKPIPYPERGSNSLRLRWDPAASLTAAS